jgi:hypothetical protein
VQVILLAIVIEDSLFFAVWEYELISISSSSFTSSHLIPELAKNQSFKLPDTEESHVSFVLSFIDSLPGFKIIPGVPG